MSRTLSAVVLALALLLTAGCAGDAPGRAAPQEPPRKPARADAPSSASAAPTRAPATPRDRTDRRVAAPTPSEEPSGNALRIERVGVTDDHLLGAHHLGPGWSVAATGPEGARPMSRCQRATMHDIGALRTRVRVLEAPAARAGQSVSRFADARSAWRAGQVLAAWRDDCAEALQRRGAALGAFRHRAFVSLVEVEGAARPARTLRRALRTVRRSFAT